MIAPLKVLILGGYGTFGGRLAQLLVDEPRLHLVIAGRSRVKADEFCSELDCKGKRHRWWSTAKVTSRSAFR